MPVTLSRCHAGMLFRCARCHGCHAVSQVLFRSLGLLPLAPVMIMYEFGLKIELFSYVAPYLIGGNDIAL